MAEVEQTFQSRLRSLSPAKRYSALLDNISCMKSLPLLCKNSITIQLILSGSSTNSHSS